MKKWKIIKSRMALDDPWCKVRADVVELPNGKVIDDYMVDIRPDFVVTVPVFDNHNILLIKQYKHGIGKFIIEFPAGLIKNKETLVSAAKRELLEETGYRPKKIEHIAMLHENPTKSTGSMHVFLAQGISKVAGQSLDEVGESEIKVFSVSPKKLWEMVVNNKIETAPMASAAIHALYKLGFLKLTI